MEETIRIVGQNVRYYRKKSRLSQEKLAEAADLHRNFVGKVERGEINISVVSLVQIARALDVEPFVFLLRRSDTHALVALAKHTSESLSGN